MYFQVKKKIDHEFWTEYFKVYDVLNLVIPYQELLDCIVEKLNIKEGDMVLDAGCGTGNLALKIKEKNANVIGIDNCVEALERYRIKHPTAEIKTHDLTKPLPFPDIFFDKVAINNVTYTLDKESRNAIFKEFRRVLKPGGKIVVSDPRRVMTPVLIYVDAVKKMKKRSGILKTVNVVLKMSKPTVKMLRYNKVIVSESTGGCYDFVEDTELAELLENGGFREISENIFVYSNQAVMNSGVK